MEEHQESRENLGGEIQNSKADKEDGGAPVSVGIICESGFTSGCVDGSANDCSADNDQDKKLSNRCLEFADLTHQETAYDLSEEPATSSELLRKTTAGMPAIVVYSSENFKIRLDNLHPNAGHAQIKDKLCALGLKPKKVKKVGNSTFAFAAFGCEEDRSTALEALQGLEWRGRSLSVRKADASIDPILQRKRVAEDNQFIGEPKKAKLLTLAEYEAMLLSNVTPYGHLEYAEQLARKQKAMQEVMHQFAKQLQFGYKDAGVPKSEYGDMDMVGKLQDIKPSPQVDGYRNKCEFSVGRHPLSSDTTVGFRLGEYKQGTVAVLGASQCKNVSAQMKMVADSFQSFVRASPWKPFDPVSRQGHWMWLLVRCTRRGDVLIMPTFVVQNLTPEELVPIKDALTAFFTQGEGGTCHVTSAHIKFMPVQVKSNQELHNPPEHLFGSEFVQEELLSMKFQISPSAFFQVNSAGAEVLYSTIADWASISSGSSVLDVCCGTGTIGIIISKYAKRVIGVEMVAKAIEDAERNAQLNDIKNITFKCGKAEDVLRGVIDSLDKEDIIAIVDPPRAGLHKGVTQAIRKCERIKRLLYVSCDPNGALKNFVDLMRPTSNRFQGSPFRLLKAVPIDMFPHTDKCELVLLFQR